MTSKWELDNMEISRIQFHTDFSQKIKNEMISKIEKKQGEAEQKELDANAKGKTTNYYKDLEARNQ